MKTYETYFKDYLEHIGRLKIHAMAIISDDRNIYLISKCIQIK